jgi:hypothetical protein
MPNRIIKESIHTSEDVNMMTDFQFRLWVSLITYVDDFGRGDARPAIIKGSCFPLRDRITNKDIEAALRALAGIGCVSLYEVDGKPYLYFPTWESHQTVRNQKSKCPAPADGQQLNTIASKCKQLQAIEINCKQVNAIAPVIQSESKSENESENESESKSAREDAFDVFWAAYPRKVGKGAARKAFAKLPAAVFPLLVPAVEAQKLSAQWRKNGGEYIPNPATWLNQERWDDKLPDTGTANAKAQELDDFYSMTQDWARRDDE